MRYRMIEELAETQVVRDLRQLLKVTRSGYYTTLGVVARRRRGPGGPQGLTPGWTPEPRSGLVGKTQNSENKTNQAEPESPT